MAEEAIGRAVTLAAEGVDPALYQARNVLGEYLTTQGKPADEIVKGLDELVKPIAENRTVFDDLWHEMKASGSEIKKNRNPWGLNYLFDQSQESMGGVGSSTKKRVIPQNILYGGKTQFNDLVSDTSIAGLATAPIPEGMSPQQWAKHIEKAKATKEEQLFQQAVAAREKKFPAEAPKATPVPDAPGAPIGTNPSPQAIAEKNAEVFAPTAPEKQFEDTITKLTGKRDYLNSQRSLAEQQGAPASSLRVLDKQIEKIERQISKLSPTGNPIAAMSEADFAKHIEGLTPGTQAYDDAINARFAGVNQGFYTRQRDTFGGEQLQNALSGSNVAGIGNARTNAPKSVLEQLIQSRDDELALKELADAEAKGLVTKPSPTKVAAEAKAAKPTKLQKLLDDAFAESDARMAAEEASAAKRPSVEIPKELTDEELRKSAKEMVNILAELPQDKVAAGRFYRGDILGAATQYTKNAATIAGRNKSALAVLSEQAFDPANAAEEAVKAWRQSPRDFIRLDKALKQIGLKGNVVEQAGEAAASGRFYSEGAKHTLIDMLYEQGKTALNTGGMPLPAGQTNKTIKSMYVPRDVVDKLKNDVQGLGYIKSTGARKFVEDTTATIKSWLTLPFIPFHTRNMLEGFTQQALGGALSKEAVTDAAMYIAGAVKDPAKKADLDRLYNLALNHDAAFRHQMGELLGSSVIDKDIKAVQPAVQQASPSVGKSIQTWFEDFKPSKVADKGQKYATFNTDQSAIIQQAAKVSAVGDDLQRFSHFIALNRQGYKPEVAAQMVRDAHLDYSKLSDFERDVMRNFIPFYSFSRRNLSRMAGQAGDPGAMASIIRAVDGGGDFVPSYVGQAVLPIPGAGDGKQRYLSGFSLPVEDELFSALAATASGDWRTGGSKAMQTLNPLIKLGVVLGTGRDLYSGRKLDEVEPRGLASLFPGTTGNVLSQLVSATPAGRLANTVNSSINSKDQLLALKLLTGIRTTDIDTEMAKQDAAVQNVSTLLKQTGMVATSENLYPRQQYRDPETQPIQLQNLLKLMGDLKGRGQQMRQERSGGDGFVPR